MVIRRIAHGTVPLVINSNFDAGLSGWNSIGALDPNAHSGRYCLTHGVGKLETTQTLINVLNGWYTLRLWVRSSGYPRIAIISLKDYGGEAVTTTVPITKKDDWLQIVVSANVTSQQCTISLYSEIDDEGRVSFDDIELVPGRAALSVMGADISSLKKSEDMGGVYVCADGTTADALTILREHGMNYARIRVWVNSPDGYHGKRQLLQMAQRLKEDNIKLLVDFHYSDTWADPGKQPKPEAWRGLDFEDLKIAVYDHTCDICTSLKAQGTPADMAQVGNEINHGMLWPDGKNDETWDNLGALLKEGVRAVRESSPETLVMLHIAEGGDNAQSRWWFDNALTQGVSFDIIGISYYPYWHGTLADLQNNLNDLAVRYKRDIIVVETAYPFTADSKDDTENVITDQVVPGYPFSPGGQAAMLADVMSMVRAVPGERGKGIFWWDATWTAVPGNGWDPENPILGNNWENQALFDFENRPLPAMALFGKPL